MLKRKKYFLILIMVGAGIFLLLSLYKFYYSMEVADPFNISVPNAEHQILITTQGSDYKDAVVTGLVSALEGRPISISVIDVSGLSEIDIDTWSTVVILQTWEYGKPQPDA